MRWTYNSKNRFTPIEAVKGAGGVTYYYVYLSPNRNRESVSDDTRYRAIRKVYGKKPTPEELKGLLLELQSEYDKGREVNAFLYRGRKYWFDKEERVALLNSFRIQQESGKAEVALWLNDTRVVLATEKAIGFMKELEQYAVDCFNNTKTHLGEIASLKTVDDALSYDFTKGYAEMVTLDS